MVVSAGLAVAGGLYSGYQQKKATDSANAATRAQVAKSEGIIRKAKGEAKGLHGRGRKELEEGYAEATKQIGVVGAVARRRLERREKVFMGKAGATSMNRGMGGSSVERGFKRSVKADTDLGIAEISEAIALARGSIARDKGHALYAADAAWGNQLAQFAGMQTGVVMAPTHQAGNMGGVAAGMSSLGQLLGLLKGMGGDDDAGSNGPFGGWAGGE